MIDLTGNPGDKNCKITFSPRPGFKQSHRTFQRELVYGHYCPRCMNVVQALFLTDEPVDLWPYEATNVMSIGKSDEKVGTILKIVPNVESKLGYSNYTSTFLRSGGEPGQHIVLKNHVLKYHGVEKEKSSADRYFEPGERPCADYTGAFALREDLLVRDVCLFMRIDPTVLAQHNLPSVEEFLNRAVSQDFRSLPAYGVAPPVILFPRERMTGYNQNYEWWQIREILKPFKKPEVKAAAA